MKRKTIIAVLALVVFMMVITFFQTHDVYCGVKVGMSYDEFFEIIPKENCFAYLHYIFYENDQGDPIIARFEDEEVQKLYHSYSLLISGSRDAFAKIRPGMTIFEVVRKVGCPQDSPTFGLPALSFFAEDGSEYIVYLLYDDKMDEYVVSEVRPAG